MAALLASRAIYKPCLTVCLEQVTSPLLGLVLPICSIRDLNQLISQGPFKSVVLYVPGVRTKHNCVWVMVTLCALTELPQSPRV